jgi:MoxR-like ATPase
MTLSAVPSDQPIDATAVARTLRAEVERVVRGKPDAVRLALCALLAGEHLLVEDIPGTGKTVLARSLAAALGGRFRRVQCTPDLLPSDLTGTTVYEPATGDWSFHPGPLFANVVLVDELNRASPRTQAALLEPMEERSVTVDGATHALPAPFLVVATQNPYGSAGTFPLPESQLDRFGVVLTLGVPDRGAQRELLRGEGGTDALAGVHAVTAPAQFALVVAAVHALHASDAVVEYALDLVEATRADADLLLGASPRATQSILGLARAHAVVAARSYVSPDDVQAVFVPALAHRVVTGEGTSTAVGAAVLERVVTTVPVRT